MKMSGFYSKEELEAMHFKSLGKNVSISRKASLYHTEEMEIGNNVRIEDFCVLNGNITIGNNVMICVFCLLDGNCGIVIEDNVTIAARVSIQEQMIIVGEVYLDVLRQWNIEYIGMLNRLQ